MLVGDEGEEVALTRFQHESSEADRSHDSGIDSPHSSMMEVEKGLAPDPQENEEVIDVVDLE